MAAADYHFVTVWRVPASVGEVMAVIGGDASDLPRWWPSVYLEATVADAGGPGGIGRSVALWTKGFLPYTLRWTFTVTETRADGFTLEAVGDFVGRGIWTFAPDGDATRVTYDWRIAATKPLLRRLSALAKPLFAANHHWAMRRGEESLRIELARRRAAGDATILAALPAPPGPTFPHDRASLRRLLRRPG